MKDLGEADVILGIKITRTENGISLDQSHYIEKILKKYNYFDSKPTCTPYDSSVKLFKNTGDSVNQFEYASIIGSLRYAADCIRPNIAYAIGLLCYNDADWNSFSDDSKAISDYIFNIARGAVALKSKKKTILAQSMMDAHGRRLWKFLELSMTDVKPRNERNAHAPDGRDGDPRARSRPFQTRPDASGSFYVGHEQCYVGG
ncbi:putative Polyprotein [Cucumis melo var. makuwa]|uniref:Putative Polyprotein n=1 Tax=Cucumis melo var. makuwa TaxID=1194695 RepID=A0A5D3CPG2_CUCMM|nr:putative Polyprotein [Cucumis melo var. makuwa]